MSEHSVVDARNQLSSLIDKALVVRPWPGAGQGGAGGAGDDPELYAKIGQLTAERDF